MIEEKEIRVYSSKECSYCTKLKKGLNEAKLNYIDIDVDDPDNSEEVNHIYWLAGEEVIPLIAIKPHLLVPKNSFNTIDEALELIKTLMK